MDYCKNNKLVGVGEHVEGAYPLKCDLCKKKPLNMKRTGRKPKSFYFPKNDVAGGITGPDVWPDKQDEQIFKKRHGM